jgi:hypothetical protein
MTLLPFLVIAVAAAAGALLTRRRARISLAVGIGDSDRPRRRILIDPGATVFIGDGAIVTTAYARLFPILGTGTGLLICPSASQRPGSGTSRPPC